MARSKLNYIQSVENKLSVKGDLSEDGTYITYTDDNNCEQEIKISDMLNAFKGKPIEFSMREKSTEELDIVIDDDES